jgi:hypothetical protein
MLLKFVKSKESKISLFVWAQINELPLSIRTLKENMILVAIFNSDSLKLNFKDKKKKGHSHLMLQPLISELRELVKIGNHLWIKENRYSFRTYPAAILADTFEIPNILCTKGHASPCFCPNCMHEGTTGQGVNRKSVHHYRFSNNINLNCNIFDSNAYKKCIEEIEMKRKTKINDRSIVIEQLPSYFPPQIIPVDILHAYCLGLFNDWLTNLNHYFPDLYDQMVVISEHLFLPRLGTDYFQNLDKLSNWKAVDHFFFALNTGVVLIGILKFPIKVKQAYFKLSSIMREICSKSESFILTPKRIIKLEREFYEYEKFYADIFTHMDFKPNHHKAGHLFREVLKFG